MVDFLSSTLFSIVLLTLFVEAIFSLVVNSTTWVLPLLILFGKLVVESEVLTVLNEDDLTALSSVVLTVVTTLLVLLSMKDSVVISLVVKTSIVFCVGLNRCEPNFLFINRN